MSPVRVATYNLYLGADLSLLMGARTAGELERNREIVQRQLETTAFPRRATTIARLLAERQLDLVGLQEVCIWAADGVVIWDFAATLVRALEAVGEPYDVVAGQPTFEGAGQVLVGGRLVDMRLQGSNTVLRRRSSPVEVEETSVGLFESALTTPVLGRMQVSITRGWCSARCHVRDVDDSAFTFFNTHTEAYDEESRNRQRDELLAVLPGGDDRVVLVGDFNSTPERVGMPPGFVDAWVAAGHPSDGQDAATCGQAADLGNPRSRLTERIDYVWVRGFEVQGSERFGAEPDDRTEQGLWPSDHAGVAAELVLRAGD